MLSEKHDNPHKGGTEAYIATEHYNEGWNDAVAALRAQADAQPVAWMHRDGGAWELSFVPDDGSKPKGATQCLPLVHPAPEAAQALSDAEIRKLAVNYCLFESEGRHYNILRYEIEEDFFNFCRALLTRSAATVAEPSKEVYDCSTRDCQCDACCIERGEAGPFNDDEQRTEQEAAQQQAEPVGDEPVAYMWRDGGAWELTFDPPPPHATNSKPLTYCAAQSGQRAGVGESLADKIRAEVRLVLTDPEINLTPGAHRALRYVLSLLAAAPTPAAQGGDSHD